MMTNKELLLMFERRLKKEADENGNISIGDLEYITNESLRCLQEEELESAPVQKFLFIEDGSVDAEELEEILSTKNPEIKVVVYRQGSAKPELVDLNEVK